MGLFISVNRTSIDNPTPLVITGSRATAEAGFWVPARGYTRPTFGSRRTYPPDSAYAGRFLLAVVPDQGTLPLVVRIHATSETQLADRRAELQQAFTQFQYPLTVALDDVEETWDCEYEQPTWLARGQTDRTDHLDRCQLAIPVNP